MDYRLDPSLEKYYSKRDEKNRQRLPVKKMKQKLLSRYPMNQFPIEIVENRYQFYREHKYVSFVLNDLERLIAKTDFRDADQIEKVEQEFQSMAEMMHGHAEYENTKLHPLLARRGSALFQDAEQDHIQLDSHLQDLQRRLEQIKSATDEKLRILSGYQFYLSYRRFVAENLHHLHEEETQILPEIQRLYTDAELRSVEAETYKQMTVEDLIHMNQILFPHFNPIDRQAFLSDIQDAAPEKFLPVWEEIRKTIEPKEHKELIANLRLPMENG